MPNHVTVEIIADATLINHIVDGQGNVDFNTLIPMPAFKEPSEGIPNRPEELAELICCETSKRQWLLQNHNPAKIRSWDGRTFDAFVGFVDNYRLTGYLHSLDFAEKVWGTKWNAYNTKRVSDTKIVFQTAWSVPKGILSALMTYSTEGEVLIRWACEDKGFDCGWVHHVNGRVFEHQQRDSDNRDETYHRKWVTFAEGVLSTN